MSELMTRIRVRARKGGSFGLLDYGEKPFEDMVSQIKQKARHDLEVAQTILDTPASDFEVAVVRGPHAQHFVRNVTPKSQPDS